MSEKRCYTVQELQEILGVSRPTIYNLLKKKEFRCINSEWKSNQDTQSFNENIEKEYQKLLETLSPEQEKVPTEYCDEIFASGAETEEFFYRLGIKDGLRLKSTVKSVLEMISIIDHRWHYSIGDITFIMDQEEKTNGI